MHLLTDYIKPDILYVTDKTVKILDAICNGAIISIWLTRFPIAALRGARVMLPPHTRLQAGYVKTKEL